MVPWLESAFLELSKEVKEIPGKGTHPQILAYHAETSLKATEDEVSWCSAFVCAMLEWSGIPSTRSAAARSWLGWGEEISKPVEGCLVVFWRESKKSWKGHVGFYTGESNGTLQILGGNQDNSVSIQDYPMAQVLSYRWPSNTVFAGVPKVDKSDLVS